MGAETIVFEATFGGVVVALGGAVAWLFRELHGLRATAVAREGQSEKRLNILQRRLFLYQDKLFETARIVGVSVNGQFERALHELAEEEAAVLSGEA